MRTYVYVDAFNLYYGAVKDTPYKWLDLQALCRVMIPNNTVAAIKYFTARVQPRSDDTNKPTRQLVYLRALQTIPELKIVFGHYLSHVVRMPLAKPIAGQSRFVQVIKTEEKGSDVNLAPTFLPTPLTMRSSARWSSVAIRISRRQSGWWRTDFTRPSAC
jgi:hypothetical protein